MCSVLIMVLFIMLILIHWQIFLTFFKLTEEVLAAQLLDRTEDPLCLRIFDLDKRGVIVNGRIIDDNGRASILLNG